MINPYLYSQRKRRYKAQRTDEKTSMRGVLSALFIVVLGMIVWIVDVRNDQRVGVRQAAPQGIFSAGRP